MLLDLRTSVIGIFPFDDLRQTALASEMFFILQLESSTPLFWNPSAQTFVDSGGIQPLENKGHG